MKATGIVRRIDDLGRIVIPKEIRRSYRIREGDPMEIFTGHNGEILLKKYSPMVDLSLFASQYAEVLAQTTGATVCVADQEEILAAAGGGKKELLHQPVNRNLDEVIRNRGLWVGERPTELISVVTGQKKDYEKEIVAPILCQGDVIGAVIMLLKETGGENVEVEKKLALAAANFLGKQLEQ